MKSTDPTSERSDTRWLRVHKRTILFVALFVFLPWVVLSGPRDNTSLFWGGRGADVYHSQHGWPFIQMHSTHFNLFGSIVNGAYVIGKPANVDTKPLAIKSFNNFFHSPERNSKILEFDLRLTKSERGEFGYWSDLENWKFWDEEHHFEIRWLGLFANLLLLFIVAIIVGWPIEKRIRNGNFFQYSLFSIGVLVTLLSVGLTIAVGTYRQHLAEQELVSNLERLQDENLLRFTPEYTDRFPRVISQLINGGKPWEKQQAFFYPFEPRISRAFSGGQVTIHSHTFRNEKMPRVLALLGQGNFRLKVMQNDYNDRTEKYLEQLDDEHRIESLDIQYFTHDWVEAFTHDWVDAKGRLRRSRNCPREREEELVKANFAINLNLKLPDIKELMIGLENDGYFTAKAQLEPFLDLPAETRVYIEGVTDDAAKYLLETAERWPDAPNFDWSGDDGLVGGKGLGEEMEEKMLQRFPHFEGQWGSVFGDYGDGYDGHDGVFGGGNLGGGAF